jgi:DNA modification methylase
MPLTEYLDRVTCGDCLEVLREVPDCSVDLCATDPPYALRNRQPTLALEAAQ